MSLTMQLLDGGVVGVLVGHEEGGLDGAAVGVDAAIEHHLVEIVVVVVDGVIKGDRNHLRHGCGGHVLGDLREGSECTHKLVFRVLLAELSNIILQCNCLMYNWRFSMVEIKLFVFRVRYTHVRLCSRVMAGSTHLVAIAEAVAVWQEALLLVANGSPVGIAVHVWGGRAAG